MARHLHPGLELDGFRLEERLHVGGMAELWRVTKPGCDIPMILKAPIVEYGEGPVHIIGILEFADGTMVKGDYYFADPFEPPEYRARWASQAPP